MGAPALRPPLLRLGNGIGIRLSITEHMLVNTAAALQPSIEPGQTQNPDANQEAQ